MEKMIVVPCGKNSAIQRMGRAGRVFDGECFRIYTENAYSKMTEKVVPELLRVDLSSFILKLLGLGIKDILGFSMLDKPP
jgi:HrpA-like RNA helicase